VNPPWLKASEGGCELLVLVQPRASRSKILGEHDGRLKIALAAPPVDGEANAALIDLLSDLLEIKRGEITLLDGHTGRRKRLKITGLDAARVSMVISSGR
jgi:uncharacterized protein (TIGR00251 family)